MNFTVIGCRRLYGCVLISVAVEGKINIRLSKSSESTGISKLMLRQPSVGLAKDSEGDGKLQNSEKQKVYPSNHNLIGPYLILE